MKTPVLFLVFNRPDKTRTVFGSIRQAKPERLFVAADGPRKGRKEDEELCRETREIIRQVDWPCDIKTLFREENLGCKRAVSSAIDWFFEHVEEGIILEDDCLPDQSFFKFCEEMLERYRENERVGMISGNNFQFGKLQNDHSYYFSKYSHIWGWATWRRAWRKYDVNISSWPELKKRHKLSYMFNLKDRYYWKSIFNDTYAGKIDTWDYQWTYACFMNNYLSIMPAVNLVSNIGFSDEHSTHTRHRNKFADMPRFSLPFPLSHPKVVAPDIESDRMVQRNNYPFLRYFAGKLYKIVLG